MTVRGMCVSWSGRHDYGPRYEDVPTGIEIPNVVACGMDADDWKKAILRRAYIRDVCRICGDTIERIDR